MAVGSDTRKAVFLDKDGTLVVDVPYNADPRKLRLSRGAGEGLRTLASAGFRLFVVSNQSGIARGYFGVDALAPMERRLRELLWAEGVAIDAFYWCPHHPEGTDERYAMSCTCRKPEPGMLTRAAAEHGLDLGTSWVVGDILNDVEAGKRAGCRAVLVANGGETEFVAAPARRPDAVATDLADAARAILELCDGRAEREGRDADG